MKLLSTDWLMSSFASLTGKPKLFVFDLIRGAYQHTGALPAPLERAPDAPDVSDALAFFSGAARTGWSCGSLYLQLFAE